MTVVQLDDTGPQALPVVEIRPPGDILDYESHYTAGSTIYYSPLPLRKTPYNPLSIYLL